MTEPPARHPFLSPAWRAAVRELVEARAGTAVDRPGLVVNATITGMPSHEGPLELHSDHGPVLGWTDGHAEDATITISTDYYTAKALVIDSSASSDALSQALSTGQLTVDGDREAFGRWWREGRIGNADIVALEDAVRDLTA